MSVNGGLWRKPQMSDRDCRAALRVRGSQSKMNPWLCLIRDTYEHIDRFMSDWAGKQKMLARDPWFDEAMEDLLVDDQELEEALRQSLHMASDYDPFALSVCPDCGSIVCAFRECGDYDPWDVNDDRGCPDCGRDMCDCHVYYDYDYWREVEAERDEQLDPVETRDIVRRWLDGEEL
jgi:hypothetical protein